VGSKEEKHRNEGVEKRVRMEKREKKLEKKKEKRRKNRERKGVTVEPEKSHQRPKREEH